MNPEFTDWIKEIRARLIASGFGVMGSLGAAPQSTEKSQPTYGVTNTDIIVPQSKLYGQLDF